MARLREALEQGTLERKSQHQTRAGSMSGFETAQEDDGDSASDDEFYDVTTPSK